LPKIDYVGFSWQTLVWLSSQDCLIHNNQAGVSYPFGVILSLNSLNRQNQKEEIVEKITKPFLLIHPNNCMTLPSQLNVMYNNCRLTKTGGMGEMINPAIVLFKTAKHVEKILNFCGHNLFLFVPICCTIIYINANSK